MHVAISSGGSMPKQEMLRDLSVERICPVMVYKEEGTDIVPIFGNPQLSYEFAKRNTPREYSIGTMEVSEEDLAALSEAGFEVRELDWPNKRECDIYVLQMNVETKTHNCGYRNLADITRGSLPKA